LLIGGLDPLIGVLRHGDGITSGRRYRLSLWTKGKAALGEEKMKRCSELDLATIVERTVVERDAAEFVKQQSL